MGWHTLEDTPSPIFRWQARLSAASPTPGMVSLHPVHDATLHAEGEFGGATLEIHGSNSGTGPIPLAHLDAPDLIDLKATLWLGALVTGATDETDILLTVAGRR